MIVESSGRPSSRCPVTAVTVITEVIAVPELVMNCLLPLITQLPSTSSARVLVAEASDPASASVSPNAARARPASRSGSQRSFCSGVPKRAIGLAPSPSPASKVMPRDWSTRPISSMATHRLVKSPAPPYSSGPPRPNNPSSPICRTAASGRPPWAFQSATYGASLSSANSATTRRKSSCSSPSR